MKSPCDNCPYFWEEKNRSCRDECDSYKAYLEKTKEKE